MRSKADNVCEKSMSTGSRGLWRSHSVGIVLVIIPETKPKGFDYRTFSSFHTVWELGSERKKKKNISINQNFAYVQSMKSIVYLYRKLYIGL